MTESYFLQLVSNPPAKGFRGTPKGKGIKGGSAGGQKAGTIKRHTHPCAVFMPASFCDASEAQAIFAYELGN